MMDGIRVTVTVSNLMKSKTGYEKLFLVDTCAKTAAINNGGNKQ